MFQNRHSTHNINKKLKQTSYLSRIDLHLDERELLGVKGRLHKATFADEIKHAVGVPTKSPKAVAWGKTPIDSLIIKL